MIVFEFFNQETLVSEEVWLNSWKDLEQYENDNPHMSKNITVPNHGDPLRMGTYTNKLPPRFKEEILGKAKKHHPLGTMQL